ncbi:hypothetical protein N0V94_007759 [Neodidymelliopsis sp. IMI 364377]|nr:hypothetical protein N0V94_007759 [Neodidymelliopsis sp. IMI 364377]
MSSTLLGSIDHRLPNELTLLVVDQLAHDNHTLCTLARTCRGFQQLAEEHIYKTIRLRSVEGLDRIITAFVSRNDRVRAVQTLKILYRWNERLQVSLERRKAFNECVAQMVNLREWHIESPYDNFKWESGGHEWVEGDMERFRQALENACTEGAAEMERLIQDRKLSRSIQRTVGLAQLESLTIHSHGAHADFWPLDGFHCLFRHPSLRYLHISCVTLPKEIPILESHKRKTPLTTLIFDECELETKSLLHILSTPEKLKHLTLGENVFNVNRSAEISPRLTTDPVGAIEALAAVAHSLETLRHLDSKWRIALEAHILTRRRVPGNGMRQFHSLKTIECDTASFLHETIIMNHDLAPPNLDSLIVRRHFWAPPDFWDRLPDVENYLALPSLHELDFKQSAAALNQLSTPDYICEPDRLRNRHAYAYKLYKSNINLKVSIELGRGSSLIPPYLHGEPVPEVRCLYDAAKVGFQRRISDSDDVADKFDVSAPESHLEHDTPETDQLGNTDIQHLTGLTRRTLQQMKQRFQRGWQLQRSSSSHSSNSFSEDEDEEIDIDNLADEDFDPTDEETDSELDAMIQDLQNDGDEGAFLQFIADMQEQGIHIEVEEGSEEEDEDEFHDVEEEGEQWVDAEEGNGELEEHEADID